MAWTRRTGRFPWSSPIASSSAPRLIQVNPLSAARGLPSLRTSNGACAGSESSAPGTGDLYILDQQRHEIFRVNRTNGQLSSIAHFGILQTEGLTFNAADSVAGQKTLYTFSLWTTELVAIDLATGDVERRGKLFLDL